MIPGLVAGIYDREEPRIDLVSCMHAFGGAFTCDRGVSVDTEASILRGEVGRCLYISIFSSSFFFEIFSCVFRFE